MNQAPRFTTLPPFAGELPRHRVFQLPPAAIQYLTAYAEAADNTMLVRTLDESRGLVECWVMPDFADVFEGLLKALAAEWPIQEIAREFD